MIIFWDTNVLAAAFGTRGLCADLFARAFGGSYIAVISEQVLDELRRALARFGIPPSEIGRYLTFLRNATDVYRTPTAPSSCPVRDPDDGLILAAAEAAGAEVLVTGDGDLLAVAHPTIRIVTPRALWQELDQREARRRRP